MPQKTVIDMAIHTGVDPTSWGEVHTVRQGKDCSVIQTFVIPEGDLKPGSVLVHRVSNRTFTIIRAVSGGYLLQDNLDANKTHTADLRTIEKSCWLLCEKESSRND